VAGISTETTAAQVDAEPGHRIPRYLKRFRALACLLALGACSDDSGLSQDAAFDSTSEQAAGQSVIIVGIRMVREPTRDNLIFGDYDAAAWFLMGFRGVDDSNHFTGVRRQVQLCDQIVPLTGVSAACDPTIMSYRVIELPAGRYVLSDFTVNEYKLTMRTSFVGGPESFRVRGERRPPSLLAFDVKPGEIAYIGNFDWDPDQFPAQLTVTRNDFDARSALYDYPMIHGPVRFQSPTVIPVGAYPTN
jgi:hypothetical protein